MKEAEPELPNNELFINPRFRDILVTGELSKVRPGANYLQGIEYGPRNRSNIGGLEALLLRFFKRHGTNGKTNWALDDYYFGLPRQSQLVAVGNHPDMESMKRWARQFYEPDGNASLICFFHTCCPLDYYVPNLSGREELRFCLDYAEVLYPDFVMNIGGNYVRPHGIDGITSLTPDGNGAFEIGINFDCEYLGLGLGRSCLRHLLDHWIAELTRHSFTHTAYQEATLCANIRRGHWASERLFTDAGFSMTAQSFAYSSGPESHEIGIGVCPPGVNVITDPNLEFAKWEAKLEDVLRAKARLL
jgi:hypothetical protein